MDSDILKKKLQAIFNDGLVTIIGSGLSCAEGLPGMGELASHLSNHIPSQCNDADLLDWKQIDLELMSGKDLESALNVVELTPTLEIIIVETVANLIQLAELNIVKECITKNRVLKLKYLLTHLSTSHPKYIKIITTNYDRLIEVAGEIENYWVDTGFCGSCMGKFEPKTSKIQGATGITTWAKGNVKYVYPPRIQLFKPHGSLSWALINDKPICSHICVNQRPLIIAPGNGKYKRCFSPPFDTIIASANVAIDNASSLLFLGYGFNDDHLQTHLTTKLMQGTNGLILTHTITDSAKELIAKSSSLIGLSKGIDDSTVVTTHSDEYIIKGCSMWDVENFVSEVLNP